MEADAYLAELAAYRANRLQMLRQPDSWLTLAGLFWITDGHYRIGSDPGADLVFPARAPALIGTLAVENEQVTLAVEEGVTVTHEGEPVSRIEMEHDADSTRTPTQVAWEGMRWNVILRGDRLGVRLRDAESPVRSHFTGIDTFPPDPRWRIEARTERYEPPRELGFPTVIGTEEQRRVPGAVAFEWEGETYRLDAAAEVGDEAWFVVFADATSGRETYGGGRFLYVPAPDAQGRTVIDFNRAYNPPCVFTPYATCPRPPAQNRLPIRVEAGEKTWGDH